MKNIAIITGATGGIGGEFVRQLIDRDIDELWAVGRNSEKLDSLCEQYGDKIVPITADLSSPDGIDIIREKLIDSSPSVKYLINCAGVGKMCAFKELSTEDISVISDLNCKAPVLLAEMCLPYMGKGSRIINLSSASAFQPVAYLQLYAASKAFLRSWSRALNTELKGTGITSTAVCPGWVDTDMLPRESGGRKIHYPGMVKPARVVRKAIRDADRGRDMSVCSLYVKMQHLYVNLLPQRTVMNIWVGAVRKYFK